MNWIKRLFVSPKDCQHPSFVQRPDKNVMYACGEDGAFAWECQRCGKIVLTDDLKNPALEMEGK